MQCHLLFDCTVAATPTESSCQCTRTSVRITCDEALCSNSERYVIGTCKVAAKSVKRETRGGVSTPRPAHPNARGLSATRDVWARLPAVVTECFILTVISYLICLLVCMIELKPQCVRINYCVGLLVNTGVMYDNSCDRFSICVARTNKTKQNMLLL